MTTLTTPPVSITALHREYLPQIMAIEESNSMESNPVAGTWSKKDFMEVLACPTHRGIVAWRGGKIIGFAIYCLSHDKIHVANFAVHANFINQGVGSQIINKLKGNLKARRRVSLEIDIRESNLRAQLFLKGHGFRAFCVCRNWFENPRQEDAYKFRYKLEEQ